MLSVSIIIFNFGSSRKNRQFHIRLSIPSGSYALGGFLSCGTVQEGVWMASSTQLKMGDASPSFWYIGCWISNTGASGGNIFFPLSLLLLLFLLFFLFLPTNFSVI